MCQDGVMSGAYRLWALGINPYDVLEPCSVFLRSTISFLLAAHGLRCSRAALLVA